jgi:hypothetical protein
MNCLRCNGLAVIDDSFSVQTGSTSNFHGWRCINCGMIGDDVINKNRRVISRQRVLAGSERRRYGSEAA